MSQVLLICPRDGTKHDRSAQLCEACGGALRFYCVIHGDWLYGENCPKCGGAEATAMAVLNFAEQTLGCTLCTDGDLALLGAPRRALLISRANRKFLPDESWVRAMIGATTCATRGGETLVVSADRVPWQLALLTCRNLEGTAIIAGDASNDAAEIMPKKVLRVWPKPQWPVLKKEQRLLQRDRLIGLLATCAYAIQIRPGGTMERVAAEMKTRGEEVSDWPCDGVIPPQPPNVEPTPFRGYLPPISFADRLTHFTRDPDARWPGEGHAEYLAWLASGSNFIPRNSYQTLRRILSEKKLRACGRLIRNRTPMVCFTQREPAELLAEDRWRRGLRRRTYSPYAISFLKEDLCALGARPVNYVPRDDSDFHFLHEAPFLQIDFSAGVDWKSEAEWRVQGDVDFSRIDPERIVALVEHEHEAWHLERDFGVQTRQIICSRQMKLSH